MERNHMYGLVAVAVGSFLVYLLFRSTGRKSDDAYQDGIIDDAADWFADHQSAPIADVKTALRDLINAQRPNSILDSLLRIDCELIKDGPNSIKRVVAVAVNQDGQVKLGKITRELAWDELPRQVREAYMREDAKTQTYVVVERRPDAQQI